MKIYIYIILLVGYNYAFGQVYVVDENLSHGNVSKKSSLSSIETQSKLDEGAKANYISEKQVRLKVGFRAKKGSNFRASINTSTESFFIQAFPNPFVNTINARFYLSEDAITSLIILNNEGKTVKTVLDQVLIPRGEVSKLIDLNDISEGVYFISLIKNAEKQSVKIVKQ